MDGAGPALLPSSSRDWRHECVSPGVVRVVLRRVDAAGGRVDVRLSTAVVREPDGAELARPVVVLLIEPYNDCLVDVASNASILTTTAGVTCGWLAAMEELLSSGNTTRMVAQCATSLSFAMMNDTGCWSNGTDQATLTNVCGSALLSSAAMASARAVAEAAASAGTATVVGSASSVPVVRWFTTTESVGTSECPARCPLMRPALNGDTPSDCGCGPQSSASSSVLVAAGRYLTAADGCARTALRATFCTSARFAAPRIYSRVLNAAGSSARHAFHALSSTVGSCVNPDPKTGACDCGATTQPPNWSILLTPNASFQGGFAVQNVSFCMPEGSTAFVSNAETGACDRDRLQRPRNGTAPPTLCQCTPGGTRSSTSVLFLNLTTGVATSGNLVVCDAAPVPGPVVTLTVWGAIATGMAVMSVLTGGPVAAAVQGSPLIALGDCTPGALVARAEGAAVPYAIGTSEARGILFLFAVVGGVMGLHALFVTCRLLLAMREVHDSVPAILQTDNVAPVSHKVDGTDHADRGPAFADGDATPSKGASRIGTSIGLPGLPNVTLLVAFLSFQGLCFEGVRIVSEPRILRGEPESFQWAVAALAVAFLVIVVTIAIDVVAAARLHDEHASEHHADHHRRLVRAYAEDVMSGHHCALRRMLPSHYYLTNPFNRAFGAAYDSTRPSSVRYFGALELAKSATIAGFIAPQLLDPALCVQLHYVLAVFLFVLAAVQLTLRPFRRPLDNVLGSLLATTAGCLALDVAKPSLPIDRALVVSMILYVALAATCATLFLATYERLGMAHLQQQSDEAESERTRQTAYGEDKVFAAIASSAAEADRIDSDFCLVVEPPTARRGAQGTCEASLSDGRTDLPSTNQPQQQPLAVVDVDDDDALKTCDGSSTQPNTHVAVETCPDCDDSAQPVAVHGLNSTSNSNAEPGGMDATTNDSPGRPSALCEEQQDVGEVRAPPPRVAAAPVSISDTVESTDVDLLAMSRTASTLWRPLESNLSAEQEFDWPLATSSRVASSQRVSAQAVLDTSTATTRTTMATYAHKADRIRSVLENIMSAKSASRPKRGDATKK